MTVVEMKVCKAMLKFMMEAVKECPPLKRPLKPVRGAVSARLELAPSAHGVCTCLAGPPTKPVVAPY